VQTDINNKYSKIVSLQKDTLLAIYKEIHNNYILLIKQVLQCTVRPILILIVDPCDSSTNVKPKQT